MNVKWFKIPSHFWLQASIEKSGPIYIYVKIWQFKIEKKVIFSQCEK